MMELTHYFSKCFKYGCVSLIILFCDFTLLAQREYISINIDYMSKVDFLLVENEPVCLELDLAPNQIAGIKDFDSAPLSDNIKNLVKEKQKQIRSLKNDKEIDKIRSEYDERIMRMLESQRKKQVKKILSSQQYQRFVEIFLQVYGPSSILDVDENVLEELRLSDSQIKNIKNISDNFNNQEKSIRASLGRYSISEWERGASKNEVGKTKDTIKELKGKLIALEKEKDLKILSVLKKEQLNVWEKLLGSPVKNGRRTVPVQCR